MFAQYIVPCHRCLGWDLTVFAACTWSMMFGEGFCSVCSSTLYLVIDVWGRIKLCLQQYIVPGH